MQTLDPARVDVDLFINDHRGEMMAYIPEWVNILPECKAYKMIESPIKNVIKAGYLHIAAARLWAKICFRYYAGRKHPVDMSVLYDYVNRSVVPFLPSLKEYGEYDLAIACLPPYGIVPYKVKARKKACWIHTDYTQIDVNHRLALAVWKRYDYAMSISKDVTRTYCSIFPEMRDKIIEIENILSPEFIRRRAESEPRPSDMPKNENGYTLLTIGRFCYPKRLEVIPSICRHLTEKGLSVKWYIIGYGGSDDYIRKAIIDERMENNVILLGKRDNPYPYIKACDWYIQPSRYEGKSIAVREAQILCKPVIITDYPTSSSQVQNGTDGVIVPLSIELCSDGIAETITNDYLWISIVEYLSKHNYGKENNINGIYNLLTC